MLDSAMTYYQAGLGNILWYEITFNDYEKVIVASGQVSTSDAMYKITDIVLEYEIVAQPDLASRISTEYQNMALQYDRILRHRLIPVNKSDDMELVIQYALKGILVLSEEESSYARNTSKFYNPKIEKVIVIVEGKPNQLYAQRMRSFEQYDEICKYFAERKPRDANTNEVQKHLQLHDFWLSSTGGQGGPP